MIDVFRRDNAFDSIRLVAATSVIFSHAFVLVTGLEAAEPFFALTRGQSTIGRAAVAVFFVVSGLLISASFDRSKDWLQFGWSRVIRLIPALWVCCLLLAFVMGPIVTTYAAEAYFRSDNVYHFLKVMFFVPSGSGLPGVFHGLPSGDAVNGSLWTLRYEVACYVLGTFLLSLGKRRIFVVSILWISSLVLSRLQGDAAQYGGVTYHLVWLTHLFRFYGAGMLIYLLRDKIVVRSDAGWLACILVAISAVLGSVFNEVLAIAGSYCIVVLAYNAPSWFKRFTHRGDISYGVYIYAFPVQQLLVPASLKSSAPILMNSLLSLAIVLVLATLSWRLIEKPALSLKKSMKRNAQPA